MDLGAIWEPHGSIWDAFERLLYDILLIKGTPALPRYAPRSVTISNLQRDQENHENTNNKAKRTPKREKTQNKQTKRKKNNPHKNRQR